MNDLEWTQQWWSAVRCAGVLFAFLLLVDWATDRIALWRSALWFALAGLLFVALFPARVSAGADWLASCRLGRERRVRTDLLVSVRCLDGISPRLLLRDTLGGRVEIDPEVLVRNPQLWRHLDEGARKATADGLLLCGQTALRRLSTRMDRETARAVFRASGLDQSVPRGRGLCIMRDVSSQTDRPRWWYGLRAFLFFLLGGGLGLLSYTAVMGRTNEMAWGGLLFGALVCGALSTVSAGRHRR